MRFYLMAAFEAPVSGGQRLRLPAGTTIADSVGNSQAGDVIVPWLCANPSKWLTPLDSTALQRMWDAGFTDAQVGKSLAAQAPTGADSIR